MAVLAAAQLLDELMGRNRNVAPNEKKRELSWEDPEFCPYFLVKVCPHDLFINTRADLGACPKVHDEEVRQLYEQAKPQKKLHYQEEFVRFCTTMINDVQRKIQKGKNRLALSNKADSLTLPASIHKHQDKIDILNERINDLEAEAERAGTEGNVEQAQGLMKLCDKLKDERDELMKQTDNGHWSIELAQAQEKQMEVCEVCGAFLIVGDAQQRIDDHLSGKQHLGFSKLKSSVAEVAELMHQTRQDRRGGRSGSGDDTLRERERRKDVKRSRDRSRSEHRLEKEERGLSKSREREKERMREREREREREKERERERLRREKEHVERKEREREKKHRCSDRNHERRHHHHHHHHHRQ